MGWMIFAGIILLLTILMICPVVITFTFDKKLKVKARYLFFKYSFTDKKDKKRKHGSTKKTESGKAEKGRRSAEEIKDIVSMTVQMTKLITGTMKKLFKKAYISKFDISVVVASEDAADTAVQYGYYCAAIYPFASLLLGTYRHTNKYSVSVYPDFDTNKTVPYANIKIRIKAFSVICKAFSFLGEYIKNNKEGGAYNDGTRNKRVDGNNS